MTPVGKGVAQMHQVDRWTAPRTEGSQLHSAQAGIYPQDRVHTSHFLSEVSSIQHCRWLAPLRPVYTQTLEDTQHTNSASQWTGASQHHTACRLQHLVVLCCPLHTVSALRYQ